MDTEEAKQLIARFARCQIEITAALNARGRVSKTKEKEERISTAKLLRAMAPTATNDDVADLIRRLN